MSLFEMLLGAGMLASALLYARMLRRREAEETPREALARAARTPGAPIHRPARTPAPSEAPAGKTENLALLLERFDKTARMRLDEFEAARRELLGILERAEAILERAQTPTPRGEELVRRARPRGDTARIDSPRTAREASSTPARPAERAPELRVGFQDLE